MNSECVYTDVSEDQKVNQLIFQHCIDLTVLVSETKHTKNNLIFFSSPSSFACKITGSVPCVKQLFFCLFFSLCKITVSVPCVK